ncbi:hypothetical protein [Kribbella swartbergensis]
MYYVHRFDEQVPVEETMATLHDVLKGGCAIWAPPPCGRGSSRRCRRAQRSHLPAHRPRGTTQACHQSVRNYAPPNVAHERRRTEAVAGSVSTAGRRRTAGC